jgi:sugar phosphate permease
METVKGQASGRSSGALRWSLPGAMIFPILIAYIGRLNVSFAIAGMGTEYGWSLKEIGRNGGFLMSIFYVSYGLACILLSPVAERIGPRRSLVISIIVFSILTVLCAPLGMVFGALVLLRVLNGIGQGIIFPMMNVLTKNWFPAHERSRANGIWCSAGFWAMVIAPFILNPMIRSWGWRMMFYVTGAAGCVVALIPTLLFIRNSPREHPRITTAEKTYIESGMGEDVQAGVATWPEIKKLFGMKNYRLMIICGILSNTLDFGMMSWFPIYLSKGRGLEASNLTFGASLPYVFSIFGIMLWGYLGDKTNKRAVMTAAGFLGTGIALAAAALSPSIILSLILFGVTIFIKSSWTPHEFSFLQYIVPKNQTGAGIGMYTGVAMIIGGGLGPALIGAALAVTGSFTAALLSLVGVSFVGGAVMFIVSKSLKY